LSGVAFHLIGMILRDFNYRAPRWFMVDAVQIASAASGARAAGIELPAGDEEEEQPTHSRPNPHANGHRPYRERVRRQ
jgi:hypothetical protein